MFYSSAYATLMFVFRVTAAALYRARAQRTDAGTCRALPVTAPVTRVTVSVSTPTQTTTWIGSGTSSDNMASIPKHIGQIYDELATKQ